MLCRATLPAHALFDRISIAHVCSTGTIEGFSRWLLLSAFPSLAYLQSLYPLHANLPCGILHRQCALRRPRLQRLLLSDRASSVAAWQRTRSRQWGLLSADRRYRGLSHELAHR